MRGCRPLTIAEVDQVNASFDGKWRLRNRAYFTLSCYAGYRVHEVMSLKVGDIYQFGKITDRVKVQRGSMKGKQQGRDVILHPKAKQALLELVTFLRQRQDFRPQLYLFQSQLPGNTALTRKGAWNLLKQAYAKCGIGGSVACHSARKFYAQSIFNQKRDILLCQKSLSHHSLNTTLAYVSVNESEIDQAVLSI